ncbi:hypothetical protein BG015_008869 [Linnemannia schmuckeri]|uniref:Uncharacterized protein n=1 Tax=Linnemannia schmuckeri TaxID=64567 RepID=A0A9P5VA69_9FUNG|nr:hypothetical protein BG015_008869 [Linnemannia schmuckeri]
MDEYQTFQCGSSIQRLAVRWDTTRQYHYSRLKDVQEVFPHAVRFRRRGIIIFYIEDENEEYIEPRRIMHYPGDVIEVVTNDSSDFTLLTPPTVHVQGKGASNHGAAATVPGTTRSRPDNSSPLMNKTHGLTSPPLLNDQPVFSSPSPSSLPAPSPAVLSQTRTTQRPLSPPPQHYSPASSPSPEPDFEFVDEATPVTNSFAKKVFVSNNLRQLVEKSNGTYDEEAQKITLSLVSSSDSRQFFEKLVKDAKKTKELDVTLDYNFNAADSENLVNRVYKTDVAFLRLDLKGTWEEQPEQIRKGDNPKYYKLHTLLWNKKLKGLILENATYFGLRTNFPPINMLYSNLRLLHFLIKIESSSESQLCALLIACPNLYDLRLGNFQTPGETHLKMELVIGKLKKLRTLHIYNTTYSSIISAKDKANPRWKTIPQSDKPIKNIVRTGCGVNQPQLQEVIGRSAGIIEVLMLQYPKIPSEPLELRPSASIGQPYFKLTHLDLQVVLSTKSLSRLRQTLPQLSLTHLGVNSHSKELLQYVKFETLKSISLTDLSEADLRRFRSESLMNFKSWKLKTIRLHNIHNIQALRILLSRPMRRIFLSQPSLESLRMTLGNLDFSELEVLSIRSFEYDWVTEAILANKAAKFNNRMKVELCVPAREAMSDIYDENVRPLVGSKLRLARGRVEILSVFLQQERYIQAILPAYSLAK